MKNENVKNDYDRKNVIAFFVALCMFFSVIEVSIPKPLPFLRLGLANIPILLCLRKLNIKDVFIIVLCKILIQAVISGTLVSYVFVFSLCGSIASVISMMAVYYLFKDKVSFLGISVAGALGNNLAQVLCAKFIVFGESTKYIAPELFIFGLVSSVIIGLFINKFSQISVWFNYNCGQPVDNFSKNNEFTKNSTGYSEDDPTYSVNSTENLKFTTVKSVFLLIFVGIFLFCKNLYVEIAAFVIIFIMLEIKKKGTVKLLPSIFIFVFLILFSLMNPVGKVLFSVGNIKITFNSLIYGVEKGIKLVGILFSSQFFIDKNMYLPGKIGEFYSLVMKNFKILNENPIQIKKGKVIQQIDEVLLKLWK